ncbi:MAG: hypothetical protein HQL95_00075 [Magnetococcales bacterium]|nr:hypothetical protein [Magnetococcales bacterium]
MKKKNGVVIFFLVTFFPVTVISGEVYRGNVLCYSSCKRVENNIISCANPAATLTEEQMNQYGLVYVPNTEAPTVGDQTDRNKWQGSK